MKKPYIISVTFEDGQSGHGIIRWAGSKDAAADDYTKFWNSAEIPPELVAAGVKRPKITNIEAKELPFDELPNLMKDYTEDKLRLQVERAGCEADEVIKCLDDMVTAREKFWKAFKGCAN